ncbi:RNA polymerase sigma factor [Pelagerythrobacter marinus]|uniref:RNA polymerase sigma factor n=1 Tax=Pelagerythrobacter marinus TaxID=538382 RepID=UPI0020374316|nr:RNA polymerase sigma factor [Pelagerythrobacter marinus]USA38664.1 RNA polymerase sigma factor [Pelagerythrobacter marinus]WPZ07309.1 RNA polymerase sigma factor [Pelagerythrobacter marinus]
MTSTPAPDGLQAAFLAHRERLLRFLRARGAGEAAEDLLHEVWLKVSAARPGPVAAPLAYLYRTANLVMIDRYRSENQARKRERAWSEATGATVPGVSDAPSGERVVIARQHARMVAAALDALGERPAAIFRRHRIDGVPQKAVAREFGVSLSTVESDLRRAYRAVLEIRERLDED